jgi:hypothetical protein
VSMHLARGEHRDVVGLARQTLQNMGEDRVRAARLLVMLTQAQLALADAEAAEGSVMRLDQIAAGHALPVLAARAALARGMVAQHRGQRVAAREAFEHGLAVLADAPGRYWRQSYGCGSARSWPAPTPPPPSPKPGRPTSPGNGSDHPSRRAVPHC